MHACRMLICIAVEKNLGNKLYHSCSMFWLIIALFRDTYYILQISKSEKIYVGPTRYFSESDWNNVFLCDF